VTVKISRSQQVAGIPVMELRKFLRWVHSDFRGFWPEQVVRHFNFTSRRARQFIHDLQAEGLIEPFTDESDKGAYQLTDKGRSLGRSSAAKAIIRATGDKALKGLLQRAREVNASDDFLCSVEAIVLFGSYLKGEERPNDVDVAVKLKRRLPENLGTHEFARRMREHARKSNRQFSTYLEELQWPETQVKLYLRKRVRCLSFQPWDSFVRLAKDPDLEYSILIGDRERLLEEIARQKT